MDDLLKQALLYDFYGELLTEHQKEIYEQVVIEDLSFGEIAKGAGISRQGVHDLVRRCDRILENYEEKLHLVSRFLSVKEKVHRINELLDEDTDRPENLCGLKEKIRRIADDILEEL